MSLPFRRLAVSACALLLAPLLSAQAKPLATWNGGRIDESELAKLYALMQLSQGVAVNQLSPEMQQRARYELVESTAKVRIVAAAAAKAGITVGAQELDGDYKNFVEASGGEAAAAKRLAAVGMTREGLLEERKITWLMQKYMEKTVGTPAVTPDEIRKAYEALKKNAPKQLNVPDRAYVAHIVIGTKPGMSAQELAALQKKAQDVRALAVRPGADFGALAKQFSSDVESRENGGVIGVPFSRTMLQGKPQLKEFIDTAFKLKPGGVSQVIRVEGVGFDILKLTKITPAHAVTLEEATPKLTGMLSNSKAQQAAAAEVRRLVQAAHMEMQIPPPPAPASAPAAPASSAAK